MNDSYFMTHQVWSINRKTNLDPLEQYIPPLLTWLDLSNSQIRRHEIQHFRSTRKLHFRFLSILTLTTRYDNTQSHESWFTRYDLKMLMIPKIGPIFLFWPKIGPISAPIGLLSLNILCLTQVICSWIFMNLHDFSWLHDNTYTINAYTKISTLPENEM